MYAGTATLRECSLPFGFLWGSAVRFSYSLIVPYLVIFYLIPAKFMRPHRHFTTFPSLYMLWCDLEMIFTQLFASGDTESGAGYFPRSAHGSHPKKREITCPLTSSKTWQKSELLYHISKSNARPLIHTKALYKWVVKYSLHHGLSFLFFKTCFFVK